METGEIITQDGEVLERGALTVIGGEVAAEMAKAEIAQQVATARSYPRSITKASKNIISLATLHEDAAAECIYALPRGGKPIRGPSIRLAEIVAQQWGNNRVAARVVEIDRTEKVVVAEAVFHDLETNAAYKATVRRRITDKYGKLLNDDMIVVTGNAACSIARRNAILASVPKAVWNRAYDAAEGVVKGDVKTLAERRAKAISSFGTWGVKPEQIFAALGVAGEEEITLEHIPLLIGMFQAIKNGEETVESLFSNRAVAAGKQFDKVANPLDDGASDAGAGKPASSKGADSKKQSAADASKDPAALGFGESGAGAGEGAGAAPSGETSAPTDKPKATTEQGKGHQGGSQNGDGPANGADPVKAAHEAGAAAANRGAAKRLPNALRGDDQAEEAGAWLEGYDEAFAAREQDG